MALPDFKNLNAIEVADEIPMTLDKLMEIYRAFEHLLSNARVGQTVRYKVDHNFAILIKKQPTYDHSRHTIREFIAPHLEKPDPDLIPSLPSSALPPQVLVEHGSGS